MMSSRCVMKTLNVLEHCIFVTSSFIEGGIFSLKTNGPMSFLASGPMCPMPLQKRLQYKLYRVKEVDRLTQRWMGRS